MNGDLQFVDTSYIYGINKPLSKSEKMSKTLTQVVADEKECFNQLYKYVKENKAFNYSDIQRMYNSK